MKILLAPFMALAVVGLFLSIVVHVSGLLGLASPLGQSTWTLHVAIFVVWLPAVIASQPLAKGFKQKDLWKAVLRGCPPWMRHVTFGFLGYAIINFILFVAFDVRGPKGRSPGGETPPSVFAGFSGHWMAFYSMAFAILYSAAHVREHGTAGKCPNGHPVAPSASYCEDCGAKILEADERGRRDAGDMR